MNRHHKEEAKKLYKSGHTFYGIAYSLKQGYGQNYTEKQIQAALGGVENNKIRGASK